MAKRFSIETRNGNESGSVVTSQPKHGHRLEFASTDLKAKLKPLCDKVFKEFQKLPSRRLLCFFDSATMETLHRQGYLTSISVDTTGIHTPIIGGGTWPHYIRKFFLDSHGEFAFDNLIYIPHSAYTKGVSLVIVLAHEIQHFVQWGFAPKVAKANTLLLWNLTTFDPTTSLRPWELPNNREAMIVAKRVAESICGEEAVKDFTRHQISDGQQTGNVSKTQFWQWVNTLTVSTRYNFFTETDRFVQEYKLQLQDLESDIDFSQAKWWI